MAAASTAFWIKVYKQTRPSERGGGERREGGGERRGGGQQERGRRGGEREEGEAESRTDQSHDVILLII